jgi:hypothetical protein
MASAIVSLVEVAAKTIHRNHRDLTKAQLAPLESVMRSVTSLVALTNEPSCSSLACALVAAIENR